MINGRWWRSSAMAGGGGEGGVTSIRRAGLEGQLDYE